MSGGSREAARSLSPQPMHKEVPMHESHIRRTARATMALLVVSTISPFHGYADVAAFRDAASFEQQAAGNPIFDCTGMQQTSARLKAGLPVQDEWIRRTEEQLRAAERGVTESKQALQDLAIKNAIQLAQSQLSAAADMKTALENAKGFSTLKRGQWLQKVDRIKQLGEQIDNASKVGNSAIAGNNLGKLMQENRATLQDFINQISESGIADELGIKAASFAGPVGVLVVETFMVARDTALALGGGVISASEAATARQNLDQMRLARRDVANRANELDKILASPESNCTPKPAAPQDRIQVQRPADTPATPPATPAPAPSLPTTPSAKGGGGPGPLTWVLIGVAGAAGAVVASTYTPYTDDYTTPLGSTGGGTTTGGGGGTSSTTATYSATVQRSCTVGSVNANPLNPGFIEPCNSAVAGGSCGPTDFTITVTGSTARDCGGWLFNPTVSGNTLSARYDGVCGSGGINVSGPLGGTISGSGTCRGNNYTVTISTTRR